jgi:hypothetical protein
MIPLLHKSGEGSEAFFVFFQGFFSGSMPSPTLPASATLKYTCSNLPASLMVSP